MQVFNNKGELKVTHGTGGGGGSETDPIFSASPAFGIGSGDIINWNDAFGWGNHSLAGYLLSSTASSTYQPLDSDLTAIAALTTNSFGRGLLPLTSQAAVRTYIGAGTGTGDALVANPLSQFAATTSAQLAGVLSDETGTGLAVFNNAPTLLSPVLTGVASPTYAAGKLVYDTDNESLTFYNNNGNVGLQIGQEEWVRVKNNSGVIIPNGYAVYINGSDITTGLPTILPANASSGVSAVSVGIATANIPTGTIGYVTVLGVVHNLDTSAFSVGPVYLSTTDGLLTQTAPTSPNYRYRVGFVTKVDVSTGTVHVTPSTASLGNGANGTVLSISGGAQSFQTLAALLGYTAADDSLVVHKAGTETITGAKTFTTNNVTFGTSIYDVTNNRFGINTTPLTKLHILSPSIAATQAEANGVFLENSTAATSPVPVQYSPPLVLRGNGWNGTTTVDARLQISNKPTTSGTVSRPIFSIDGSINGGSSYSNLCTIGQDNSASTGVYLSLNGSRTIAVAGTTMSLIAPATTANISFIPSSLGTAWASISNTTVSLGVSLTLPYAAKTANYTVLTTDNTIDCTTGTFNVTLPTAVGVAGKIYTIKNSGAGVITVATTSSQTIDGSPTYPLSTQYKYVTVMSNGANWIITGNN